MIAPETEILISLDGEELLRRTLRPGEYVLGRSSACELCVPSTTVSRKHARLTVNFSNLFLEDLGSFNGTTLNGGRITGKTQIWHGQKIQIGNVGVELRKICTDLDMGGSLAPSQAAVLESLPDDVAFQHSGYKVGQLIGRGGMGAVLQAEDESIQRQVAMKVVLHGDSPKDVLRFIHEARITGQLEHPNIVPVHTLGADEHGQPFYTMKLVRGVTLKQILNGLARGEEDAVRNYPLTELLSIFQKVCDALRFSHSQNIIHRDLKPDNIMIGDYGEVLVMDWGLAKTCNAPEPGAENEAAEAPPAETETYDEFDYKAGVNTQTGAVLGTPQYMPPEQALGDIESINERADIYSLGAILYHILTLRPPVDSGTAEQMLGKVIRGEIITPTAAVGGATKHSADLESGTLKVPLGEQEETLSFALPHLPAGRIPSSLEAVVLKAMAHDQTARYPSVDAFQKELAAYRLGFATEAEHAGVFKRLSLLLKRHRTISGAAVVVFSVSLCFAIFLAREADRSNQALHRLRKAAPTFVERAWVHLEEGRLEDALEKVSFAAEVDPTNADYHFLRARLLQGEGLLAKAIGAFQRVLELRKDSSASENLALCSRLLPALNEIGELTPSAMTALVHAMQRQGRQPDTYWLVADLKKRAGELQPLLEQRLKALPGWEARRLKQTPEGTFMVDFSWLKLDSLDCLAGMPVSDLQLNGCSASISPDLLASLNKLPLKSLSMRGCGLQDLAFLEGADVENLVLSDNPFTDLAPLKKLPLFKLNLRESLVEDLSTLNSCAFLAELVLPKQARNYESLKSSPTLKRISRRELNSGSPEQSAAEFWKASTMEAGH
jgi:serine/threonine protein kinase